MNWAVLGGLFLVVGVIMCTLLFLPVMVGGVNTSDVPEEMGIPFSVANEFGLTVMQLLPLFALIIVLIGVILAFLWWIR